MAWNFAEAGIICSVNTRYRCLCIVMSGDLGSRCARHTYWGEVRVEMVAKVSLDETQLLCCFDVTVRINRWNCALLLHMFYLRETTPFSGVIGWPDVNYVCPPNMSVEDVVMEARDSQS